VVQHEDREPKKGEKGSFPCEPPKLNRQVTLIIITGNKQNERQNKNPPLGQGNELTRQSVIKKKTLGAEGVVDNHHIF